MVGGRPVLLDDEHPGAHTADRELLVALDARAFGGDVVTEEGHERLERMKRALAMELPGGPHPAHDAELAGLRGDGLGVDRAAGSRAQRPAGSGR